MQLVLLLISLLVLIMEGESTTTRNWAGLHEDVLSSISGFLTDPKDFIVFRAVCRQWRNTIELTSHGRFLPWILKSDYVGVSGNLLFNSLSSEECREIHIPALKGRRSTRLAGFGAGHIIGIDMDDHLSAVLVNPLTGVSTQLPRLPELFGVTMTHGFVTDPAMAGDKDVTVVIYNWWPLGNVRIHVALWCPGSGGWAVLPSERFWTTMPQHRRRLATDGPQVLEQAEQAAAAAIAGGNVNGGQDERMEVQWVPGMEDRHLMEHQGKVRFLSRMDGNSRFIIGLPQVTFELHDMLGNDHWAAGARRLGRCAGASRQDNPP